MRAFLILLMFFSGTGAFAQVPGLKDFQLPLPTQFSHVHGPHANLPKTAAEGKASTFSATDADQLAAELTRQFKVYDKWSGSTAACTSDGSLEYAVALHVRGEYQTCIAYANQCAPVTRDPRVILRGALCAQSFYDFAAADKLFELAAAPKFNSSPDFEEILFQFASYALFGPRENEVEAILARHPTWNLEERKSWEGVLRRMGDIQLTDLTIEDVDLFLDSKIATKQGTFLALLKSIKLGNVLGDFKYPEAIALLKEYAPTFENPLLWYTLAYNILYYGLDQDYELARKIYDAYDPYAHQWSWFPNENNTYNYSQIYSNACPANLTRGQSANDLGAIKRDIQKGTLSAQQALTALVALNVKYPNKADILTTIGGMYSMLERHNEAISSYWSAHRLCRYYNRANWGLLLEKRFKRYFALPEYQKNLDRLNRELSGLTLPAEMPRYIVNWNSLGSEARRRVYYGGRIWLPYVKMLSENGRQAYIKYAFELLSDGPGMSHMRDRRVMNTPNDNRLWDDVRGLGGNTVIADLSEVMQTIHGDYNLLGHEVAHQFHYLMGEFHRPGWDCIVKLYEKAQRENNFPDAYAAGNKEEHFGQLVTYYLVPSDSPKRFGLNRRWLETNDGFALAFIQSIEASKGEISRITCPL